MAKRKKETSETIIEERKDSSFEELIAEALKNAIEDRERAVDAFDKTKGVYDISLDNPSSLQGLMLLGQSIPKLLDIANKSNEQIIRLAQIREKELSRTEKSNKPTPFNIDDIRDSFKSKDKN